MAISGQSRSTHKVISRKIDKEVAARQNPIAFTWNVAQDDFEAVPVRLQLGDVKGTWQVQNTKKNSSFSTQRQHHPHVASVVLSRLVQFDASLSTAAFPFIRLTKQVGRRQLNSPTLH